MKYLVLAILIVAIGCEQPQPVKQGESEAWTAVRVAGEVEVIHPWGRTATMPVTSVRVIRDEDSISVVAETRPPVFEGKPRSGYFMPIMRGKLTKDFPQYVQTISKVEVTGVGDNEEFRTLKTAMIVFDESLTRPISAVFTCTDYASFDVDDFIRRMKEDGTEMSLRAIEDLKGFNELGFRQRSFTAVFE